MWLRANPRVNTEEPASLKAVVNDPCPMPQLTSVKPIMVMSSQVTSSITRATGSETARIRSLAA